MKRLFVINPSSGGGSLRLAVWEGYFRHRLGAFDYVLTRDRDDIVNQTRAALRRGVEQIIAVGGDGTVNAVANGFFENGRAISQEACLAVARAGSGSDYFKSLRGTAGQSWMQIVAEHERRSVDLGRITFSDGKSTFFANMATLGLGAEVVKAKQRLPAWIPSRLGYLLPTLAKALTYASQPMRLRLDDKELEEEVLALFVGKGRFVGGGMRLGGEVTLHDGKLGVVVVRGMGVGERLRRLPQLYLGLAAGSSVLETSARKVTVMAPRPVAVETDGDPLGTTDLEIEVAPRALSVCFPVGKEK